MRHAFDEFEIPFDLIFKERVRAGGLRADYDVILVPNQGRTAKGLVFDVEPRGGPRAYTKTERYRFLGDYGSSEDITGGMGLEGVLELRRFVEDGGLLITLGEASHVPPEYGLTREIGVRRPGIGLLRAGAAGRGGGRASRPSDLLRLRRDADTRPLRQRPAPRRAAAAPRRLGGDDLQRPRAERPSARRQPDRRPPRRRRRPRAARAAWCCSRPTRATAGRTTASSACSSTPSSTTTTWGATAGASGHRRRTSGTLVGERFCTRAHPRRRTTPRTTPAGLTGLARWRVTGGGGRRSDRPRSRARGRPDPHLGC